MLTPFTFKTTPGRNCYLRIFLVNLLTADVTVFDTTTETFVTVGTEVTPWLPMVATSAILGPEKLYNVLFELNLVNTTSTPACIFWAVFDNPVPNSLDEPISDIMEGMVVNGRLDSWVAADGRVSGFESTALAQLQRKVGQAVTVNPVAENDTITIVVGDSYVGEDGRKITLQQRISNDELNIAGWTIRIHWSGGTTIGSLVGEVLVPTGRIAVALEFTAEQTALIAGTYDYVIDATNEDERRITLFTGKLRAVSYPRAS